MPGILDSFTRMMSADVVNKTSLTLGVDPSLVSRGVDIIGPVILGGFTRTAASAHGPAVIFRQLPLNSDNHWVRKLTAFLSGGPAVQAVDEADTFFGVGANAISTILSERLGFNLRPLLGIAVPMMLGILSRIVKSQNLNSDGLVTRLRTENDAFMNDPAHRETAAIVFTALRAGDKANALREMFDEGEWLKVRTGPVAALYHIANITPMDAAGLAKEFTAAADAVAAAAQAAPATSLLGTAFCKGLQKEHFSRLTEEHPAMEEVLSDLHDTVDLVARKSPADAQAYREVIINAARRAAQAGKSEVFPGLVGMHVSDAEQRALDDIRSALR